MEVTAGYVFVFEDDEGLGAVPHTFHVFVRYFDEPRIRQPVFRVRIERSVEYRVGQSGARVGQVRCECFHQFMKVYFTVEGHYREFVTAQYAGCFFIDFQLVILQHADDIFAISYSCDHCSCICLASASIRKLSAFSWRV